MPCSLIYRQHWFGALMVVSSSFRYVFKSLQGGLTDSGRMLVLGFAMTFQSILPFRTPDARVKGGWTGKTLGADQRHGKNDNLHS